MTPADHTVPTPQSGPDGSPTQVGPYRILQVLGEGGMGMVYEAEQTEPIRRRVALKVMKVGMDTKEVVARFEAERQALAVMNHPGIAKVLDAGASDRWQGTMRGRSRTSRPTSPGRPTWRACPRGRRGSRRSRAARVRSRARNWTG